MIDTPATGGRRARLSDEELAKAAPKGSGGKDLRIGIFVVLGLLSFVAILFLLTDPATMRGRYMLVTTMADAGGVRRGDPVQMRGVIIGRINGFEMMQTGRVAIRMELEGAWQIPTGSVSRLGASGLLGGRTLEVIPADAATFHAPWDTLPGSDGGTGFMGSAEELSDRATSVLQGLDKLLDDPTIAAVKGSVGEMETLLTELSAVVAEQRATVRSLTRSLARSAENLETAGPDAARAIARADSALATLTQTGETLDRAAGSLKTILERMERGEGTLGRLSSDDALYDNVNRAAESLALLLDDFRANPKKYVNVSIF